MKTDSKLMEIFQFSNFHSSCFLNLIFFVQAFGGSLCSVIQDCKLYRETANEKKHNLELLPEITVIWRTKNHVHFAKIQGIALCSIPVLVFTFTLSVF